MHGGTLGDDIFLHSWLLKLKRSEYEPDIVMIQEFDGVRAASRRVCLPGFAVWRHWPCPGSRSMAFLIRRLLVKLVRWRSWRGRVGGLLL